MSKLVWDATGERKYETGLSKGVLYVMENGSYGEGVAWNGLTAVSESPSGAEATDLWADDRKYLTLRSAEDFGMTIEAYTYPDEFAVCDGSAVIDSATTGGIKIGQQKRATFGFSYVTKIGNDTDEDAGYIIHIVYGCTASPSERSRATINDSPEAITFSWEVSTTPVDIKIGDVEYKPSATIEIDSTKFNTTELKTKLKTLEDKLYGVDADTANSVTASASYLPLPAEVVSTLS